jgi:hypothetical protein
MDSDVFFHRTDSAGSLSTVQKQFLPHRDPSLIDARFEEPVAKLPRVLLNVTQIEDNVI